MITIATKELKTYFQRSKAVKPNNILPPIYEFSKLICDGDSCSIYKSNNNAFIIHQVEADFKKNITILIDDNTVSQFVANSSSAEITLSLDKNGQDVHLSDGVKKFKFRTHQPELYAKTPVAEKSKSIEMGSEVLEALFHAKNHVHTGKGEKSASWFYCFVNIAKMDGKYYVIAANQIISYFKGFKQELPCISLDPDVIPFLSSFTNVLYSQAGNYHIFDAGTTQYGFIQQNVTVPNFSLALRLLKTETYFIADKKSIIEFCGSIVGMDSTLYRNAFFQDGGKNKIIVKYINGDGSLGGDQEMDVEKNFTLENEFTFNPKQLSVMLNSIDSDKVRFRGVSEHQLVISSDEEPDQFGTIMEIQPVSEIKRVAESNKQAVTA